MKIVVTGGAGFIGSHIVDRFIDLGHSVVVIDNLSTGQRKFLNPKATFYEVDIRDRSAIGDIFRKERPEVLSHHAAQMDVRKSVADPVFDAEINLLGLLNLLEAGRANSLRQVIFASSGGAIYGDAQILPTPESYWPRPASPYGVSKLSSEYYLDFYFQAYRIPYIALRYGNVYGPRQNPHGEAGVVAIFAKKLLAGELATINGDGKQSRDFVFVQDVVAANVAALQKGTSLTINIGTGVGTDINTIFDALVRLTQSKAKQAHGEAKPGEQRISVLDVGRAFNQLQWKPSVTLEDGLTQTVTFFRNETK